MAQEVGRWLEAPPRVADLVAQVMEGSEDPAETLRQVREGLTEDPGHVIDAAEVERVLDRLSGMLERRWR